MNKVFDINEIKKEHKQFSKLSFTTSIITLVLFIILYSSIPKTIKVGEGIPDPPIIVVIAVDVFCLLGAILTFVSFAKKEPSSWFKWIGAILNILLFFIILGSIIFAKLV